MNGTPIMRTEINPTSVPEPLQAVAVRVSTAGSTHATPAEAYYNTKQLGDYGQACFEEGRNSNPPPGLMSEALERVIAEQQAQIDRLKRILDSNDKSFAGFNKSQERMAHAAFGLINEPSNHERMWALKMELQAQGWCTFCEASICECEHD